MNIIMISLIVIDVLLFAGVIITALLAKKKPVCENCACVEEKCECTCEECSTETVEEVAQTEETAEVVEEVATTEETVEDAAEDDYDDDAEEGLNIPRSNKPQVPLYTKILNAEQKFQDYYNEIRNKFKSYRGVNARISKKCDSFRKGRELIAKLTFTGKTMKLYLKLNPANYNEKVYFQKDASDKKAYSEVPMFVKIRSDRAFKNAIKLIEELMVVNQVDAKKRYAEVDYLEFLRTLETAEQD